MDFAKYYSDDYWNQKVDPVSSHLIIINRGPWMLFGIICVYFYLVLVAIPNFMKNREPLDLRPYMLVLSSMEFGIYAVSVPIIIFLGTQDPFWMICKVNSHQTMLHEFIAHGLFFYSCMLLIQVTRTFIILLRKRKDQDPIYHAISVAFKLILFYITIKYYPRGGATFFPFTQALSSAFQLKYLVHTSLGDMFRNEMWSSVHVIWIKIIFSILTIIHSVCMIYFSCSGPEILKYGTAAYSILEGAYFYNKLKHTKRKKV